MKNITVNPTIWQSATYSPYVAETFNNAFHKTTKDKVLKKESKDSLKAKSLFKIMIINFLGKISNCTNTFYV